MEKKQHITQPPCMTPWFEWGCFFLLWFFYTVLSFRLFPKFAESFWRYPVGILLCGCAVLGFHLRFLCGDMILTDQGVTWRRRIGTVFLSWADIIQVAAIRHDSSRVLVLLKRGGSPMKTERDHLWFFLRNPGKVLFLPDDKFTRSFVAEYYGAEDIREAKDTY